MSTLIEHIVLMGFAPEATTEQIDQVIAELVALQDKIPGVVSLQGGYNVGPSKAEYPVVLTGRFVDQAAFDAYGPHPEHQRVVAFMKETGLQKILVADFQVS